jgi:BMFP domain-containing protein YqiC
MAKAKMGPQIKGTADAISMAVEQGVKKVLDSMGLATREDIAGLEKRVEKLESRAAAAPARKKPGRPAGKKATGRKPAKKAAGKKRAKKAAGKKRSAKKA